MNYLKLSIEKPVKYNFSGKFKAPNSNWKHLNLYLYDFELIVVTEGILYIESNNNRYEVHKNQYLILYPQTYRIGYKESNCSFYWLHFSCLEGFEVLKPSNTNSFIDKNSIYIPTFGTLKNMDKLVILMKQLQDCDKSYKDNILNSYMTTTILCEINNQLSKNEINSSYTNSQIYNDILDYIKWNIEKNIKVSDIAFHFGYNEKYLSRIFKKIKGISIKQYIIQEKIELAKYKLCDSNNTIVDISNNLGFNDYHHFMKSLKKNTGLTPTEYRNSYSKRLLFYK